MLNLLQYILKELNVPTVLNSLYYALLIEVAVLLFCVIIGALLCTVVCVANKANIS